MSVFKASTRQFLTLVFRLLLCSIFPASVLAEPLRVAVMIPLSGPLAEYGAAIKNGFTLAQTELVDAGAVEFYFEDTRYDNATTVSLLNQIASAGDRDLLYIWGYGPAQAGAPIAEARKLPALVVSGEQGVNANKSYILRFSYRVEQFSQAILDYLRSESLKNIYFVKSEIAYMNNIIDGMQSRLTPGEQIEVIDSFQMSDMDFRSTITKLKRRRFDVLGVFLVSGQVSQFFLQAKALNLKFRAFGASPFESVAEIKKAQGLMDGSVFPAVPVVDSFHSRYLAEFGNDVQLGWAANAYDFVKITQSVSKEIKGRRVRGLKLLDAYKTVQLHRGAQGDIRFHEDRELGSGFEFNVTLKAIRGEKFDVLTAK